MATNNDLRLLELARERGIISDTQLQQIQEEQTQLAQEGRAKTATRIAIEKGLLSDEDTQDLETEAWVQQLPSDLGGYRLVRLVGRGGMAVVFEAQDVYHHEGHEEHEETDSCLATTKTRRHEERQHV